MIQALGVLAEQIGKEVETAQSSGGSLSWKVARYWQVQVLQIQIALGSQSAVLTCVYCGQEYARGTASWGEAVLTDHIKHCAKHPMRKAEEVGDAMRAAGQLLSNVAYNLAQSSAYTPGDRDMLDQARKGWDAALTGTVAPLDGQVIALLVAGGYVSQAKVDEARAIAEAANG